MKQKRCPSRDEIIRFFEGGAAEGQESDLLSHVLACPDCLTVFEAAREIRSRSEEILGDLEGLDLRSRESRRRLRQRARREIALLRGSGRRPSLRWARTPAVGAALVLLTLFVILPNVRTRGRGDLERNGSPAEIELVRPRSTAPLSALSFKWTSRPGVRDFRLEIYDRALEPVYQSGPLAADGFTLPAAARAAMRRGQVYFWKIVAALKDGQPVESEFAKFIPQ